jgi:protein-tyrosine-phosphatase
VTNERAANQTFRRRLRDSPVGHLIALVLKHPLVVRLKGPLRSVMWRLKGRAAENPPLPQRVESVLFVCLGNICRSPFGEHLARRVLDAAGRSSVRTASAGIRPSQDNKSPREACRVATTYGFSLEEHRPQALTREMMDAHDMVVVMELKQLEQLRAMYPEHRSKVFLLSLFDDGARTAYERLNIADPFGQPLPAFEVCFERIARALPRCLAAGTRA